MIEFIKMHGIAILALLISILVFILNRQSTKLNSYNQHGHYSIYLKKTNFIEKLFSFNFRVRISDSFSTNSINLDYTLKVKPLLGGISRAYLFDNITPQKNKGITRGITRTLPVIKNKDIKSFLHKQYAFKNTNTLSSSDWFPYFLVNGQKNKNENYFEKRLCRYHNYIEISDYSGNTEIWYISFSLLLSNLSADNNWSKCKKNSYFKYYKFEDYSIVSPRDIPANLNKTIDFDKDLTTIKDDFITGGFSKTNFNLQLYEMKEYRIFIDSLMKYIQ